jgi:hypothetical protein
VDQATEQIPSANVAQTDHHRVTEIDLAIEQAFAAVPSGREEGSCRG